MESGFDALSQRVPLFPLPLQHINDPPSMPSPNQQQQAKKTLAGTVVESAKKQSVALVHKDIAMLAKNSCPCSKYRYIPTSHLLLPLAIGSFSLTLRMSEFSFPFFSCTNLDKKIDPLCYFCMQIIGSWNYGI